MVSISCLHHSLFNDVIGPFMSILFHNYEQPSHFVRLGDVFKVCSSTKISLMAMSQPEISFGKYSGTWHLCPSIFNLFDVHYLELAVLEQFSPEPVHPQESPRWARVSLRFRLEKYSGTRYICLLFLFLWCALFEESYQNLEELESQCSLFDISLKRPSNSSFIGPSLHDCPDVQCCGICIQLYQPK